MYLLRTSNKKVIKQSIPGVFCPPDGLGLTIIFYLGIVRRALRDIFRLFRWKVECFVVDKTYTNIMEFLMLISFKPKRNMEEDSTSKKDLFICEIT